jgi:hypothetical protein
MRHKILAILLAMFFLVTILGCGGYYMVKDPATGLETIRICLFQIVWISPETVKKSDSHKIKSLEKMSA